MSVTIIPGLSASDNGADSYPNPYAYERSNRLPAKVTRPVADPASSAKSEADARGDDWEPDTPSHPPIDLTA